MGTYLQLCSIHDIVNVILDYISNAEILQNMSYIFLFFN